MVVRLYMPIEHSKDKEMLFHDQPHPLSLSHTEYDWAHGSNTVYSVIHGLTGTSIELQPCLGMTWYDLDSNVARVCTNKARIYSINQGLSRFAKRFSYDCTVPSTVCYGLVRLNMTFTRLTGHLQGLHTVPLHTIYIRY